MTLSAACRVYIAFSDGPLVESPTWTNVTAYVREVRISRGRQNELDDFQAGTATIVLDNQTRRFDPDYTSGAYYPNVKVRRQIKVESVYSGFEPIFRGLIQSWQQQWPGKGKDATTTVQCADLFSLLATWELPDTAHELVLRTVTQPVALWPLDDDGVVATDLKGVASGQHRPLRRERVDALVVGGDGASQYTNQAGDAAPTTWTYYGASSTKSALIATVRRSREMADSWYALGLNEPTGGSLFVDVGTDRVTAYCNYGIPSMSVASGNFPEAETRHVCIARDGTTLELWVNGVSQGTGSNVSITAGFSTLAGYFGSGAVGSGVVDEAMLWHGSIPTASEVAALSSAALTGWANDSANVRIQRILDLLGVPSGLYSLGVASTSVGVFEGGTDAVSYLQSVARSDRGRLFVNRSGIITFQPKTTDMGASSAVTFADDSTANAIRYSGFELELDDRLVFNDVTVTGVDGSSRTDQDATSISTYSRRSRTFDTQLPAAACRDSVAYYLDRYAEPQVRGRSWTVHPERTLIGSSTRGWDSVVVRELGDIVTIKRTPAVGSSISKTVQITSIEHNIDLPEGRWDVTFTGAPVDTATAFRWGTSTWGGSDGWS